MSALEAAFDIIRATICGILEWIIPREWYAKDISNDIALITGAGSGLGREIAMELARAGASLIIWDIDQNGMQRTKELVEAEFQASSHADLIKKRFCRIYYVDVSKRECIQEAAKKVHLDLNPARDAEGERYVSLLVNNAGIYYGKLIMDLTDAQIEKIFAVNILSHFWTVRAFMPKMIEHKRGHILEIASYGGISGSHKQVAYCSTKFATVGFEESLSTELDYLGLANNIHTTQDVKFGVIFNPLLTIETLFSRIELMTPQYVAHEAVMSMRCNHSRIFLPKFKCYMLYITKTFTARKALWAWMRALQLHDSLRNVRGRALDDDYHQ